MTIWVDPAKEGIGLCFVFHDPALQRRHDFLAVADRQANFVVEQGLPALVNADVSPGQRGNKTSVTEKVGDRVVDPAATAFRISKAE